MKHLLIGIASIILFMAAIGSLAAQNKNSVEGDLEALRDLYESTNGDSWSNNSGWLNGDPSSDWYGVEVDSGGRVVKLDLYKNNLSGELPETIGNLRKIQFFSVKRNPINSKIPQSIENWINAEILLFSSGSDHNMLNENSYNDHPGKTYNSSVAKYSGLIPDVFDKMPKLRILQIVWQENLESQPYPSTLYKHASLEILELQGTQLTGSLDDSFNLPEMKRFFIGNNFIEGGVPQSLGTMKKIVNLKLGHSDWFVRNTSNLKRFSGEIPSTFSQFYRIKYFFIGNHNFEGEIPGYIIKNWSDLREIGLDSNNFSGEIPKEFGNLNLTVFWVQNNNFSGTLHPDLISGMQNVIIFNIRRNNLSGELPNGQLVNGEWKGWRTKKRLRTVTLDHNNFTGPLPDMPEYVGDMSLYTAHNNNFTGGIPDTWKELYTPELRDENPRRSFNNLQLRNNNLQGVIPEWFTAENGPTFDVGGNRWSHRDVLKNNVEVGLDFGTNGESSPKPFGLADQLQLPEGSQFMYDYSHKVYPTDKIQWTKDGNPIPGATSPVLKIMSVSSNDEGLYRLELTNNGVPHPDSTSDYNTIVSEPIELKIGEPEGGPASPPLISSPENGSIDMPVTPTLKWKSVSTATSYRLQVSVNSDFSNLVINERSITETLQNVSGLEYETTYYWRLQAVNSKGDSKWSQGWSFTTEVERTDENSESSFPNAPIQYGPEHHASGTVLTPEFSWSDIGADYYILHVSRLDPTGMTLDVMIEDTTFSPNEILGDGTIHDWRVRGVKNDKMGAWSDVRRFTTREENLPAIADLQSPVHFAQEVDPGIELVWEDVDADSYKIRVINKKTVNVIFSDVTATNMYTPTEALPDTSEFIWQVKSIIGDEQSAWGPRWEFSTGLYEYSVESPSLISPIKGTEFDNLMPVFEWSPVDADHYVIVVSKEETSPAKAMSGLQSETIVIEEETLTSEYTLQSALEPETIYYWRVQAVKGGEEGEWSEVWEFSTSEAETSVSVDDGFEKPIEMGLHQNYPNPFNPSTQISFTLDEMKRVSLAVYDMAGRKVATIVDDVIGAGSHVRRFNASNLSSGVYMYHLVAGKYSDTKKMTLIK